jgi:hypothetical protein
VHLFVRNRSVIIMPAETITRSLDRARTGVASVKVVTPGVVNNEGMYYRVSDLGGVSELLTFSAYIRGDAVVRLRMQAGLYMYTSGDMQINDNRWKRIEITGMHSGTNDVRLYFESGGNTPRAVTFYVDCVQLERKPYATSFCDGDQPGCRWNSIDGASNSSRSAYTREGGRWITLAGDDQNENLYFNVMGGLGMPPITNNVQSFSQSPGGYFQNTKIQSRLVTLSFHAKYKKLGQVCEPSLSEIHKLRSYLIDLVKPDRTAGSQEFLLEYTDGDMPVYFSARYDGGLEGEWDVRNQWINSFPLRLLLTSPMFHEDDQEIATLNFVESFICNAVAGRINGRWSHLNYGIGRTAGDFEIGRKGELYFGGNAILTGQYVNYSNLAIDPFVPAWGTAYWDGVKWNAFNNDVKNGSINDLAVAPNGDVYITGSFTTIGALAANRIAKWDGSAWSALGTGLSGGDGLHISIAPNGDLYAGGEFTTAGGVTVNRIARWDGSAWYAVGQKPGLNGGVQTIAISKDGLYMYVGGSFTDQFGLAANALRKVAKYTVSTNTFEAVGAGFNLTVLELIISPANILYACGDFTLSGSTTINRIAQLQGATWIPLSSGMNGTTVRSMDISDNGDLIAVGDFTSAGGVPAEYAALWNGSSFVPTDFLIAGGVNDPVLLASMFSENGDFFVGGSDSLGAFSQNQSKFSAMTIIDNVGTAEVSPFIYILGPGTLRWLENRSTGKRVHFNLSILDGEEVYIDFGQGKIESTIRGDLSYAILPGSDFGSFSLLPGENEIITFMVRDVDAIMKIGYTPTHWSADATKREYIDV